MQFFKSSIVAIEIRGSLIIQALLDKQNAMANEIAALEQKLDELQSDEYRRRSDMINQ
jgi:hypothetical protein